MPHPRVPVRGAVPSAAPRAHPVRRPTRSVRVAAISLALAAVLALALDRGVEAARAHLVGTLGPAAAGLSMGDLITLKGAVAAGDAARAEALLRGARE